MIGWLMYLMLKLSRGEWVLRLPVTLLPFALAAGIYIVLRRVDEMKAALAALAFMLLPANVWGVFITSDTPLIFFSVASAFAFWLGIIRRSPGWQALAGVFLGLAFGSSPGRAGPWPARSASRRRDFSPLSLRSPSGSSPCSPRSS